jgi:hypothetical protein
MWISPSVMMIEMAADDLKNRDPLLVQSQIRELSSFGDTRAQRLGATGMSIDFAKGYELGLQTARILIRGNVNAVKAKVEF